jgi:hypothetical protein
VPSIAFEVLGMTNSDILNPNPFANPILAKHGNDRARDIYTDVGLALDRWEHCETSFGILYSALIETEGGNHILMRSFGAITASKTKRDMIWAGADAFFTYYKNADLKKQTRHLLNLYFDASSRRNEIAHAMVMGDLRHKIVDNKAVPLPTIWFLVPPTFATRKQEVLFGKPKFRYSTREISHFTKCFEELSSRGSKLAQLIRAFRASLRDKPQQPFPSQG